jgi:type IV secretion system protein TrbI
VSRADKDTPKNEATVDPISGPSGLVLHPKPEEPRRVSRRAAVLIGCVLLLLFMAFGYGGYKRSASEQAAEATKGIPKAAAPATAASSEFTKAIPLGNAAVTNGQRLPNELIPPGENKAPAGSSTTCGVDQKTNQRYRFDPMTGRPCDSQDVPVERIAIRRPAPPQPRQPPRELSEEERRMQDLYRREQEALTAPTAIRSSSAGSLVGSPPAPATPTPSENDLAQIAALESAITRAKRNAVDPGTVDLSGVLSASGEAGSGGRAEYDQNMQTRKEQFLENPALKSDDNYLKSTRTAPFSDYEIKAGWEIPAVLEQSLNSDLPGEIKALVMSNVYDTATGRYLLIPQGARLVGKYDSHVAYGQDGVQVVWNRIIFPDASSVDLAGMEGLDSHGNAGLRYKVDRHYRRLFGFAALTSLFSAAFEISQRRNQSVLTYPNPADTAAAAVGREMSQTGATTTRRNLNVQPTIKVPVGYKFSVRVNRDILFDAPYEPLTPDP